MRFEDTWWSGTSEHCAVYLLHEWFSYCQKSWNRAGGFTARDFQRISMYQSDQYQRFVEELHKIAPFSCVNDLRFEFICGWKYRIFVAHVLSIDHWMSTFHYTVITEKRSLLREIECLPRIHFGSNSAVLWDSFAISPDCQLWTLIPLTLIWKKYDWVFGDLSSPAWSTR